MKIFYFITKSEIGGAQVVVYELLLAHKQLGDEVVVMAYPGGWLEQRTKEMGYKFVPNIHLGNILNLPSVLRAISVYKKSIKDNNPDIVSCHSSMAGFLGRVSLLHKYPIVFTAHGWGFTEGVPLIKKFIMLTVEKIAGYFTDKIICVSEFDRRLAISYHIAPQDKICCIHNGINVGDRMISHSEIKEKVTIVFPARFVRQKSQRFLIDIFAELPSSVQKKSEIIFVGDGPLLKGIKEYTEKNGLSSYITFAGELSRDKCLDVMARSDIFVLTSFWEGFPMTIIEALQLGLPVLASDVGGISEIVDASVGLLILKYRGRELFSRKLQELIMDDEERKILSRNARVRGELFTSSQMSQNTFTLYESILKIKK